MEVFTVVNCPTTELSLTNKAIINSKDKFAQFEHIAVRYPKKTEAFVFSVLTSPVVEKGRIAFNLPGRKWASLSLNNVIEAAPYKFEPQSQCLNTITFTTDFASKQNAPESVEFDTVDMAKQFSQQFYNQAFTVGQLFGFSYNFNNKRVIFELKVKDLEAMHIEKDKSGVGTSSVEIGLTTGNTIVMFERAEGSNVRLTGKLTGNESAPEIFNQNWDFSTMGIGGLSEQFNKLFRRAFSSRLLPPRFAEEIGEEHVRGILLFGPPGTGKTLIARQIGKMLLAREPKIVNGPEVLNKYVGESEANIRLLFKDAEEEQAKAGIHSGLHMIIFDEIDAICKTRGSSASSSGVGDNVVNQLLSKIDGVNALNNVLLIGMTNRKDLIDEALTRPGRLEVQIEIGLPNKEGRLEILNIHTQKMRAKNILDSSVDMMKLADLTRNYSGAELVGLIKAARSRAVTREIKEDMKIDQEVLDRIRVTWEDFKLSMEQDIKPALGASEDALNALALPIIKWDPQIEAIQLRFAEILDLLKRPTSLGELPYFLALVGDPCVGLTTLAANLAAETNFPFIRIYRAEASETLSENGKIEYMKKLFQDASRSELSCVVIDDLDAILEYSDIGPRFLNAFRTAFRNKSKTVLKPNHRMLVICTCNGEQVLSNLSLAKCFNQTIRVPSITQPKQVLKAIELLQHEQEMTLTPEQCRELVERLDSVPFKMGIKELKNLLAISFSAEPQERVKLFLERMHSENLILKTSRLDEPFRF